MAISLVTLGSLDLTRWQFSITTVYYFILAPLTIRLSPLVALIKMLQRRTGSRR